MFESTMWKFFVALVSLLVVKLVSLPKLSYVSGPVINFDDVTAVFP